MDVPRALDFGQHDHIELLPDGGDDLTNVVEHPRRIERVDPGPQAGLAVVATLRHGYEAASRSLLGVGRDRILQVAEHHVDLMHQFRHFGADLLDMRRDKVDHPLEPQRQVTHRRWRADRERLKKVTRQLHATTPQPTITKGRMNGRASPSRFSRQSCLGNGIHHTISPRIRRGCEATGITPSRITARRSGPIRSTR